MRDQRSIDNNKQCQAETILPLALLPSPSFPEDFPSRDTNVTLPI